VLVFDNCTQPEMGWQRSLKDESSRHGGRTISLPPIELRIHVYHPSHPLPHHSPDCSLSSTAKAAYIIDQRKKSQRRKPTRGSLKRPLGPTFPICRLKITIGLPLIIAQLVFKYLYRQLQYCLQIYDLPSDSRKLNSTERRRKLGGSPGG
jgi:hypothetical protein